MVEIIIDGVRVWTQTSEPSTVHEGKGIREANDAARYFATIRNLPQEAFAVLDLNGANKPLGPASIITLGLLDQNQVHPREVFSDAIKNRAASIIIAHNHPSGTLEASPEDIALTKRLKKAGKILGIPVLDHIILTAKGHVSMQSKGYM
jgi:DNA repair protein RadC